MLELTNRQLEVLRLMADGKCDKAIAGQLNITARCVRFHVSAALKRLGCETRAAAIATAVRRGTLQLEPTESFSGTRSVRKVE